MLSQHLSGTFCWGGKPWRSSEFGSPKFAVKHANYQPPALISLLHVLYCDVQMSFIAMPTSLSWAERCHTWLWLFNSLHHHRFLTVKIKTPNRLSIHKLRHTLLIETKSTRQNILFESTFYCYIVFYYVLGISFHILLTPWELCDEWMITILLNRDVNLLK